MVVRVAAFALVVLALGTPAFAAFARLELPGGTNALRRVMDLPVSVTDEMLLAETVRSVYGGRDPFAAPMLLRRLQDHVRTSSEPVAPGPLLPLTPPLWEWLLQCQQPCKLAEALVSNREALLLYHGLVASGDETLRWIERHPQVLWELIRGGAAAFAFAGPFVQIRGGRVEVPGGPALNAAWEGVVGAPLSSPELFVRNLMRQHDGRIAWLYSTLSQLDSAHLEFATRDERGTPALPALVRYAIAAAPEWRVSERPFWRTPFDFTLVLGMTELDDASRPRGSGGFWRTVFQAGDLERWTQSQKAPLTAESLLDVLFEQPYEARLRWEVFALGQRTPGVEADSPDAGRMLRGARRHPALAQVLDRIGVRSPEIVLPLHRAAARIFDRDEAGARGELGAWQGAVALVERAMLSGGLDKAAGEAALARLAALALENPRAELTAWFMDALIGPCAGRAGAPRDAERLVLQVIAGALTPSGPRQEPSFVWEDLTYALGAAGSLVTRMEQVRAAQGTPTVEDARVAWQLAGGMPVEAARALAARLQDAVEPAEAGEIARRLEKAQQRRDASAVRREARRAAESIVMTLLPALAYAPHLAVTEVPSVGSDVAFRHEFTAADDGPGARRARPWQLARGQAVGSGAGWRLQGSLLMLDLAVAEWYLRRNGEPADLQPMFDDGDMSALAQVAALARSEGISNLRLSEAAAAVAQGRSAAAALPTMRELQDRLAAVGIDPWRRRAIAASAADPQAAAARLSYAEAWRLGGAPGALSPHPAVDGGAHFGPVAHSTSLVEGRRGAGLIGSSLVDAQLRVAIFLEGRKLPAGLFGDVIAGALSDLIERTHAARPDDFGAFAAAVMGLGDTRMEEHLLALVADGTLGRPSSPVD